jgi:hypothetical protein
MVEAEINSLAYSRHARGAEDTALRVALHQKGIDLRALSCFTYGLERLDA